MVTDRPLPRGWLIDWRYLQFVFRKTIMGWGSAEWAIACMAVALMLFELVWLLPAAVMQTTSYPAPAKGLSLMTSDSTGTPINDSGRAIDAFYGSFPPRSLILDITAQLNRAAEESGVRISQADYHLNQGPGALSRLDIALVTHATYAQLREFTTAALVLLPTTSLDGLSISRNGPSDVALDTQFRFSVFVTAR